VFSLKIKVDLIIKLNDTDDSLFFFSSLCSVLLGSFLSLSADWAYLKLDGSFLALSCLFLLVGRTWSWMAPSWLFPVSFCWLCVLDVGLLFLALSCLFSAGGRTSMLDGSSRLRFVASLLAALSLTLLDPGGRGIPSSRFSLFRSSLQVSLLPCHWLGSGSTGGYFFGFSSGAVLQWLSSLVWSDVLCSLVLVNIFFQKFGRFPTSWSSLIIFRFSFDVLQFFLLC